MGGWGPQNIPVTDIMADVEKQAIEIHARRPLCRYEMAAQEILDTERHLPGFKPFCLREDGCERDDVEYLLSVQATVGAMGRPAVGEWEQQWRGEEVVVMEDDDAHTSVDADQILRRRRAQDKVTPLDENADGFDDAFHESGSDAFYVGCSEGPESFPATTVTPAHGTVVRIIGIDPLDNTRRTCSCASSREEMHSIPAHLLSASPPPPLPGGYEAGDVVHYVGPTTRDFEGKILRPGTVAEVVGPDFDLDRVASPGSHASQGSSIGVPMLRSLALAAVANAFNEFGLYPEAVANLKATFEMLPRQSTDRIALFLLDREPGEAIIVPTALISDGAKSAPTINKLPCKPREEDELLPVTEATSQMSLESTKHFHTQRTSRGLDDKTELKRVVKHGSKRPSQSTDGRPTIVHELVGTAVTTDWTSRIGVTAWRRKERAPNQQSIDESIDVD